MQRAGKRLNARRASPGMAFALAQRRNTAGDRFPVRPKGAFQRIQSFVAVLAKGNGHSLRTAPCLESSGTLCIRNYYLDRVLGSKLTEPQCHGSQGALIFLTID